MPLARRSLAVCILFVIAISMQPPSSAADAPVAVDGQPLAANVERMLKTLDVLGAALADDAELKKAIAEHDAATIQKRIDPNVLLIVSINPELRVKVQRGEATAVLRQGAATPVLVKIINEGAVMSPLRISSPQAGAVYAGTALAILQRQAQTELAENPNPEGKKDRFLDLSMHTAAPMTDRLSGLEVEYAIALIASSEAGPREATIAFDVGQGTQDLGFRAEVPVLFRVDPGIPITIRARDENNQPSTVRLTIRDEQGRVHPSQSKRLAPDFFFQPQVYRHDGETVLLPPGKCTVESNRGPEYAVQRQTLNVEAKPGQEWSFQLQRWIDPAKYGFYSGDHHIHGAGCSHYTSPTEGVAPADMFRQVKGEALNVGCVLTWGPCFDFQRRYFSADADLVSEPLTVLKYDLEISGFGSQALGHVCLLDLKNQTYPGTDGTSLRWPTWTVPVLKWTKEQGGVTGYPHSSLRTEPKPAAEKLLASLDGNGDGQLSADEAKAGLLAESWDTVDVDRNGSLSLDELTASADRQLDKLPNLVVPDMGGGGALEICVSTAAGVCDFISAMDTSRIGEWNTWYHLMNCGFPLKVAGETDFPCMSSRNVGQGRTYVQLGNVDRVDYSAWCDGIASGRSYASDGYAHALSFHVAGKSPGEGEVALTKTGTVVVGAEVAFAPELPKAVAYGTFPEREKPRISGDTVVLHGPRSEEWVTGGERLVEVVVNGVVVASQKVPADGAVHPVRFEVPIERSSWVALRQFPQLHTNPVNVIVDGKPIRASRDSARWCAATVRQLWTARNKMIAEYEREAAKAAYDDAIHKFEAIAAESP
jgi:hypothetical protein